MQKRPWELSTLLALRDGEPHEVGEVEAEGLTALEQDQLNRLTAIRSDLRALPDVEVDEAVWAHALPVTNTGSSWLRFPLATAASVFFASALGIYFVAGGVDTTPGTLPEQVQATYATDVAQVDTASGERLAALMNRSRMLEQTLQGTQPRGLSQASASSPATDQARAVGRVERRLLFRLADIDTQIARLYEQDTFDADLRLALWRQRVDVLQNLVAVLGGSEQRLFEDSRSM